MQFQCVAIAACSWSSSFWAVHGEKEQSGKHFQFQSLLLTSNLCDSKKTSQTAWNPRCLILMIIFCGGLLYPTGLKVWVFHCTIVHWQSFVVSIISGSFSSCPSQETVAFLTEGKTAMLGSWHRLYMLWANWSGVPDMDAMGPNKNRIKLHICWWII